MAVCDNHGRIEEKILNLEREVQEQKEYTVRNFATIYEKIEKQNENMTNDVRGLYKEANNIAKAMNNRFIGVFLSILGTGIAAAVMFIVTTLGSK